MGKGFPSFIALLFVASILSVHASESDEVGDESPFLYKGAKKGPGIWGEIKPEWKVCETGKYQSPIDLLNERVTIYPSLGNLNRSYKPAPAKLKNRGHDIMVSWEGDAGSLVINGTEYKLMQCHWHTPSEHTVKGKSFKMELHMVHNSSAGQIAVVGILYNLGQPDPFLAKVLDHVKRANHQATHKAIEMGIVNPREIKFGSRKYYRYMGSLTVPPCTEGIPWTLLKQVKTVSKEQIRMLRDLVHDGFEENARPVQQLDGRTVYMYTPKNL